MRENMYCAEMSMFTVLLRTAIFFVFSPEVFYMSSSALTVKAELDM